MQCAEWHICWVPGAGILSGKWDTIPGLFLAEVHLVTSPDSVFLRSTLRWTTNSRLGLKCWEEREEVQLPDLADTLSVFGKDKCKAHSYTMAYCNATSWHVEDDTEQQSQSFPLPESTAAWCQWLKRSWIISAQCFDPTWQRIWRDGSIAKSF